MRLIRWLLFFFSFTWYGLPALAQPVINFSGNFGVIGGHIALITDSSSSYSLRTAVRSQNYRPSSSNFPNLMITPYSYWVRFTVKNNTSNNNLALQFTQPMVDVIDYYRLNGDSLLSSNFSGQTRPFNTRLVSHQTFIYPFSLNKGNTATFYLHLKSGKQLIIPLYLGTVEQVIANAMVKDITFGVYIGVILVMLLYNMFIYFSVKDRNYLYYVSYLLIVLISQACLEGYVFRFILPGDFKVADLSIYVATALIGVAAIEFSKHFLNARLYTPILYKTSFLFYALYTVQVTLALTRHYNASYQLMLILAMTSALYVLAMAITILAKGNRTAKFYLIAWSVFIVCVIIYVLKDFNIIFPYNSLTASALLIGSALEAILISFALADRINTFKLEKERSQLETLNALQDKERIISEQNVVLEQKVAERTTELIDTNNELSKTLDDLQQTQLQLVESEKMASLGQLTAGIAHEINNPINFVTSNISPLRRDIDALLDAFLLIEEIGASEITTAEKHRRILALKEDIDFEYVKTEIDHLLNGINEGAKRTAEIVKGLKVFSRLDEEGLKLADINEGLSSTLVIANNMLDNVKVSTDLSAPDKIYCYPGKLNQVFLNVITNAAYAVKARFEKSAGGTINIRTSASRNLFEIAITDNGIGMDELTLKKVFEPFFTTKEVGEGTGLGMSIAYNIIKKHEGKIIINSELGRGSEFLIIIPANLAVVTSHITETSKVQ